MKMQKQLDLFIKSRDTLKEKISLFLKDETIDVDQRWKLFESLPPELISDNECELHFFIKKYKIQYWEIYGGDDEYYHPATTFVNCTERKYPNQIYIRNLKNIILISGYTQFGIDYECDDDDDSDGD